MNSLEAEPMMSLHKFVEQTGLSAVTVWRYQKKMDKASGQKLSLGGFLLGEASWRVSYVQRNCSQLSPTQAQRP